MTKKAPTPKKRNSPDSTERNTRASNKDDTELLRQIRELRDRVSALEDRWNGVG